MNVTVPCSNKLDLTWSAKYKSSALDVELPDQQTIGIVFPLIEVHNFRRLRQAFGCVTLVPARPAATLTYN
jgi:hypothetical protein